MTQRTPLAALFAYTTLFRSTRLLLGESETGWVPRPVRATVCGLVAAASLMVSEPLRVVMALGLKVTEMVQRSEKHTSEPQSQFHLVWMLLVVMMMFIITVRF